MAEKIVNGTFNTNLSNWSNIGAYAFVWSVGEAWGYSGLYEASGHQHRLGQYFSVAGACVSAVMNAKIRFLVEDDDNDGHALFYLYLIKPDSSSVELASAEYYNPASGTLQLANNLDISAHLNQVGTYQIQLRATLASGWHLVIDEPVYTLSEGSYDNISLVVTERFTKTVLEVLGGGEAAGVGVSVEQSDAMGMVESLTSMGEEAGKKAVFSKMGIKEFYRMAISVEKAEAAGMAESLERTYGYRQRSVPGDIGGLREFLRAKWKQGNVTIEREIISGPGIWTDLDPAETDWETE